MRHIFRRDLHAHIASGYHDAIAGLQNLIQMLHTILVLNFGNDLDLGIKGIQNPTDRMDALSGTHKRRCNEIKIMLDCKHDIFLILLRKIWQAHMNAGNIHALLLSQHAAVVPPAGRRRSGACLPPIHPLEDHHM